MECFEFEDCGPRLKAALIKQFGSEEIAAQQVAAFRSPAMQPMNSSRRDSMVGQARELLIAASAAQSERGKALLALVGDALMPHVMFGNDVALIPGILDEWLKLMDSFPAKS